MGYRRIDTVTKAKAMALLQSHWKPQAIAEKSHCHVTTARRWDRRNQMYGGPNLPHASRGGRPTRIHTAAGRAIIEYQRRHPYAYQDELVEFLYHEWDIAVSRATVCRFLKKNKISRKQSTLIGPQSRQLRVAWLASIQDLLAHQLVFLDESIFKRQSCWRAMAYSAIGTDARYSEDMRRGDTYSILPAYTLEGYLPCTGIKKGFYNSDQFYTWIIDELLPHCNAYPAANSVIIMDNLNVHLGARIREAIEAHGCLLRFLPPYSPDFNPIELTFSLLKAWMRRHYRLVWPLFNNDFEAFLAFAIETSECDKKAWQHFKFSAGGYVFEGDYEALMADLNQE